MHASLAVLPHLMAPNGCLHAGTVVTLADTACGYGCIAKATHLGRTTQLWDAVVTHRETGKTIALFRCTQFLIYPKISP
jgi:acyl-coenzyme A thioesterase PaaI-like protein